MLMDGDTKPLVAITKMVSVAMEEKRLGLQKYMTIKKRLLAGKIVEITALKNMGLISPSPQKLLEAL